jgi:hypothetical protein
VIYVFADYELDTPRYELRRRGMLCPLEPQGFNVLVYLLPQAVSQREAVTLQRELGRLIEAELLYQRSVRLVSSPASSLRSPRPIRNSLRTPTPKPRVTRRPSPTGSAPGNVPLRARRMWRQWHI